MFGKSDIRRVSIVIPSGVYSDLIIKLGRSGIIHLDNEKLTVTAGGGRSGFVPVNREYAERIVAAAKEFISGTEFELPLCCDNGTLLDDPGSIFTRDVESDLREAERFLKKRDQYAKVREIIEREISSGARMLAGLREHPLKDRDLIKINDLRYISYIYGRLRDASFTEEIPAHWFYIYRGDRLLLLFPSAEREEVIKLFEARNFEELKIPAAEPEEVVSEIKLKKRILTLRGRLERLDSYYEKSEVKYLERAAYLSAVYSILLKISGAEALLGFTEELVMITGWVNISDADSAAALLRESCGESFYMRIATVKENRSFIGRIPVLLKNISLFRPFELLVKMMGTPGNSEIDPTPAAAIAFTVIFGVMFGDLGQGGVLAAAGYILSRYGKRKFSGRNSISDFGGIMIWCGLSAAFFGVLYGSVFSNEHLIPALLFHPMENMMELFLMAVTAGILIISAGLVFNIINGVSAGEYSEAMFGAKGGAGLAIYLSAVYFTMRYILRGTLPDAAETAFLLSPPAFLFTFRGPLGYLLFHEERMFPHGLFEYIIESSIEVIEMFSGFLGNTISFIRAGAFALSHAGLSMAVFTLAEIIDPAVRSAGAVAAVVLGNIFIIFLEGLVCSIQSMRLEYYEFFSKFFKGDGVAFTPFSLRLKLNRNGGFYE